MSRDLEGYRRLWESRGVAMDAGQMAALRAAAARTTRARVGVGLGAVLMVLGGVVAVVADPWTNGLFLGLTGALVVVVMSLAADAWSAVLGGGTPNRLFAGVAAGSVVTAFLVLGWVVGAFPLGWPWPVALAVLLVGGASATVLLLNLTLRRG